MIKLFLLTLEIATFIFVHYKTKFIDSYPNGWRQITMYAVGVLLTMPFFVMFARNSKPLDAFIAAFLGSGVGTAFGYMSSDLIRGGF